MGIVGINFAGWYTSTEGSRTFSIDGTSRYPHPVHEAHRAEVRIRDAVTPKFDELLILRFRAENESPFSFRWLDEANTEKDYAAAITRIFRTYAARAS